MSRNIDVFAAHQHREKPKTTPIYRFPLRNHFYPHHPPTPWTVESINRTEPFLPSIKPLQKTNDEGYQPFRRNDFAHNHLFVAKQKLAGVFLDQSTIKEELFHWFDLPAPAQRPRTTTTTQTKLQRRKREQIHQSTRKSTEQFQLSIINLKLKTSSVEQSNNRQWINPFSEHERPL